MQASAPDHRALLAYSRQRAADTIAGYAGIARALFENERGALTDRERALMTCLLRRLVEDAEAAIRRALAARAGQAQADGGNAPPVRHFAPGAEIFTRIAATGMLQDQALIEAVRHRMSEFQLERALRKRSGGHWSGAEAGDDSGTVSALAGESGQFVRDRLSDYLVARAARVDSYENPMLSLNDLDTEAVQRLCWNVAAVLRLSIREQAEKAEPSVDAILEQATLDALDALHDDAAGNSRAAQAADALADAGRLDAALVVEALRRGEAQLSAAMFSRLSGMRLALVYRLIFESGGTGLAVACRAVGMSRADFGDFYLLTRNAQIAAGSAAGEESKNVMNWYDRLAPAEAEKVAAYWRRPPGYLHALWRQRQAARAEAQSG